jgi:hypothetical protein
MKKPMATSHSKMRCEVCSVDGGAGGIIKIDQQAEIRKMRQRKSRPEGGFFTMAAPSRP